MATVQVRYIVKDVEPAIDFYCRHLGFREIMRREHAFAMLERGDLRLVLNAPGGRGGGGQAMADGTLPQPGGWNRFAIEVEDPEAKSDAMRKAGVHFRSNVVKGVGGSQIIADDPSGNPVELFEPSRSEARLGASR